MTEQPLQAGIEAVTGACPYLLAEGGAWRAARALPEHRCHAVRPPGTLSGEQQRNLCLVIAHQTCPLYLHAREAEDLATQAAGIDRARVAARRTVALTRPIPVALERPSAVPAPTALAAGTKRAAELILVAVMILAAAALIAARFGGFGLFGAGP